MSLNIEGCENFSLTDAFQKSWGEATENPKWQYCLKGGLGQLQMVSELKVLDSVDLPTM